MNGETKCFFLHSAHHILSFGTLKKIFKTYSEKTPCSGITT